MGRPHRHAVALSIVAIGVAAYGCGSFGADDPGAGTGPDPSSAEGGLETGPANADDAALACVPRSVTEDTGAPDASCEGPQATVLSSSDGHCGICAHSCLGEGCANGHCHITDLGTGASGPPALGAIAGDKVYFVQNGVISRTPLGGGPTEPVFAASAVPGTAATSLSAPFFAKGLGWTVADQMRLVSFPLTASAGTPSVVIGGKSARVTSDGDTVYWAHDDTLQVREVGNDTPVFDDSTVAAIYAMAADHDGLFLMVGTKGAIAARARLLVRSKGGSVREVLSDAAAVAPPVQMTLDGGYVYWADALGGVWRVSKTSTTKEPVMQLPPPRSFAKGIAVDAQNVYVVTSDDGQGGTVPASFFVAPKCGGPARLIQSDTIWSNGLLTEGSHLYWSHNATIARMAK